jgi:pyruvate/2-oxoglutarate dehydrogenase complex dihydrolipoamide dehydrogenase (E3) component
MSEAEQLDLLVLGGGEGGKFLAWHMAKSGHRTAVVERKLVGGSCPNTNCLPSKNEIWSAKVADLVHHASRFGMITGPVSADMPQVLARKKAMVDGLIAMHLDLYRSSGAELIMGTGRFVAPKTIEVSLHDGGTRVLTATRIALNVGTHATVPNIPVSLLLHLSPMSSCSSSTACRTTS